MTVSVNTIQSASAAINSASSMTVDGNYKWIADNDTSETWTAIGDTSETWTPIADNSESWQIAA
jgi:hypothetical protein